MGQSSEEIQFHFNPPEDLLRRHKNLKISKAN